MTVYEYVRVWLLGRVDRWDRQENTISSVYLKFLKHENFLTSHLLCKCPQLHVCVLFPESREFIFSGTEESPVETLKQSA